MSVRKDIDGLEIIFLLFDHHFLPSIPPTNPKALLRPTR